MPKNPEDDRTKTSDNGSPSGRALDQKHSQPAKNHPDTQHIFLLDYDGCLSWREECLTGSKVLNASDQIHRFQTKELGFKRGIKHYIQNESLNSTSKPVLALGSNRQSIELDLINRRNPKTLYKDSAFDTLESVANLWDLEPDNFLMNDLVESFGDPNWKDGQTFTQAKTDQRYQRNESKNADAKVSDILLEDPSKIFLVYTHIQKAALKYPDQPITLHFVDDRKDILEALQHFFSSNPKLIPKGVELRLGHYDPPSNIHEIKNPIAIAGEGQRNPHYRNTIRAMRDRLNSMTEHDAVFIRGIDVANTLLISDKDINDQLPIYKKADLATYVTHGPKHALSISEQHIADQKTFIEEKKLPIKANRLWYRAGLGLLFLTDLYFTVGIFGGAPLIGAATMAVLFGFIAFNFLILGITFLFFRKENQFDEQLRVAEQEAIDCLAFTQQPEHVESAEPIAPQLAQNSTITNQHESIKPSTHRAKIFDTDPNINVLEEGDFWRSPTMENIAVSPTGNSILSPANSPSPRDNHTSHDLTSLPKSQISITDTTQPQGNIITAPHTAEPCVTGPDYYDTPTNNSLPAEKAVPKSQKDMLTILARHQPILALHPPSIYDGLEEVEDREFIIRDTTRSVSISSESDSGSRLQSSDNSSESEHSDGEISIPKNMRDLDQLHSPTQAQYKGFSNN